MLRINFIRGWMVCTYVLFSVWRSLRGQGMSMDTHTLLGHTYTLHCHCKRPVRCWNGEKKNAHCCIRSDVVICDSVGASRMGSTRRTPLQCRCFPSEQSASLALVKLLSKSSPILSNVRLKFEVLWT